MNRTIFLCIFSCLFLLSPSLLAQEYKGTTAQNIILIIGDGMGNTHVDAGRLFIYGNENETFPFESFPYQAQVNPSNLYNEITDSAASATAMATGQKVGNEVLSITEDGIPLETAIELHQAQGKKVGVVTTSSVIDASPAAFISHQFSRYDKELIVSDYLINTRPNVILGADIPEMTLEQGTEAGYTTISMREQLQTVAQTEYLLGLFGWGELPPIKLATELNEPSLAEMTATALTQLEQHPDGFFLLIEHEGTDSYSHLNNNYFVLHSMADIVNAIDVAIEWKEQNPNTLIVITADHETGGLSIVDDTFDEYNLPMLQWSTQGHTTATVPIYATGVGAEQLTKEIIDNTEIFHLLKPNLATLDNLTTSIKFNESFQPLALIILLILGCIFGIYLYALKKRRNR